MGVKQTQGTQGEKAGQAQWRPKVNVIGLSDTAAVIKAL